MPELKIVFFVFCMSVYFNAAYAQEGQNIKFGKISATDFQNIPLKFDTGANAIILSDIGRTKFEGNGKGFFSIVYTRFVRIKILNKNGYNAADFEILLYNDRRGTSEKISELKGSTYNLKQGVIQETKLDEKSVFTERHSKIYDLTKFSMPALNEGSIFELEYTIKSSNFSDPPTWIFQSEYPCLWSEYEVTVPSVFHYYVKMGGDGLFDIKTDKQVQQTFSIRRDAGSTESDEFLSVFCTSIQNRWVKKNVPALKKQPYLGTINNYVPKISFELNYFQQGPEYDKDMEMGTWVTKSHKLLTSEDFGFELDQDNTWMDARLKEIIANTHNIAEEIKAIYFFVRNNFHCTDYSAKYLETSLKDVFNKRSGNVAELNLLLVAMFRHQHITADPAVLSTRDNGVATSDYPLMYEYNYVICIARDADKLILLDASQPNNSYGSLPSYCYNWGVRAINEKLPYFLLLSPDSVTESRVTNVLFVNDDKGYFSGGLTTTYGNNESYDIREKVRKSSEKEYLAAIQDMNDEIKISNQGFDSLNIPDRPLVLHFDLDPKGLETKDILYFNPVLIPSFDKNPFVDVARLYPVEMTAKIDYTYLLNMDIPKGFRVDEVPKSARVNYNDNQGIFEYLIQQSPENIQMRVHLKFNQATFPSDQYATLRDFFSYVVKKENEQIVFRKIK